MKFKTITGLLFLFALCFVAFTHFDPSNKSGPMKHGVYAKMEIKKTQDVSNAVLSEVTALQKQAVVEAEAAKDIGIERAITSSTDILAKPSDDLRTIRPILKVAHAPPSIRQES